MAGTKYEGGAYYPAAQVVRLDSAGRPLGDGGPAFPQFEVVAGERDGHGDAIEAYTVAKGGMSLRDWFAGQALSQLLSNMPVGATYAELAEKAYRTADAMLEARGK